jgi:hypothetical protein
MAGSWPSGNCPRWTMCRATCLNKLVSVMLKSMRGGHLPRGSEPGSKTDGLEAKGKKPAQTPSASRRSLGANLTPQCHKGAMGDKFSQLNHKNHRRLCHRAPGPSLRGTKQSIAALAQAPRLPRRCAPRNDGGDGRASQSRNGCHCAPHPVIAYMDAPCLANCFCDFVLNRRGCNRTFGL